MYKRYQYYGPSGITWTKWFRMQGTDMPKFQYGTANSKVKLLNEYSETNPDEQ